MFDMYQSGLIQCTEIVLSNVPKWYRQKLCTKVVIVCTEVAMYRSSTPPCTESVMYQKRPNPIYSVRLTEYFNLDYGSF